MQHSSVSEVASLIGQTPEGVLKNLGLVLPDGTLTLAVLILMGKYPQKWLPAFTVRCVSFVGNSIGGTEFRDKSGGDADGNAVHLYKYIMSFLTRNLHQVQVENEFNSQGELEVSATTLSEMVVNAILHRSYVIEAPLRVFIFDNRIEIHSPGLLPEGVSMESIKLGASVPRNKLLFNHGIHLLPYTGAGSGIARALHLTPDISFFNDDKVNEFVVKIVREEMPEIDRESDRDNDREDRDNVLKDNNLKSCAESGNDRESDRDNDREDRDKTKARIPYKKLEGFQKNIIQFCTLPRTSREILKHIGYGYNSTNMTKFIKPLLEMGYLEMTNPEKPNSKGQKYHKTTNG